MQNHNLLTQLKWLYVTCKYSNRSSTKFSSKDNKHSSKFYSKD